MRAAVDMMGSSRQCLEPARHRRHFTATLGVEHHYLCEKPPPHSYYGNVGRRGKPFSAAIRTLLNIPFKEGSTVCEKLCFWLAQRFKKGPLLKNFVFGWRSGLPQR
jgi:hypothetical protein